MPSKSEVEYKPVGDDVPRVDGAVAVGEDLQFQRRWWRFEKVVWTLFALVLVADLSGILGRGPLAKAERKTSNGSLDVKYERVERENTSSILSIVPGAGAVQDGKFRVFVSDSIVQKLGAQRIIPAPETSLIGDGGVTYTFAANQRPMLVQIELKPAFIGSRAFSIGIPGGEYVQAKTFVLP